jgi:16S rRNA (guanine966-N2)-methyltransferase
MPASSLRVHGGAARGRRLLAPPGIRPTQGLVKEAIFNQLGPLEDAAVLDLFAGSGALGIEALSRGAASAVFVERGERQVAAIRRNLRELGWADRAQVIRADVPRWLGQHADDAAAADVILLDPPYDDAVLASTLSALDGLVGESAVVVVEHGTRAALAPLPRLATTRSRRYGDTQVSMLEVSP